MENNNVVKSIVKLEHDRLLGINQDGSASLMLGPIDFKVICPSTSNKILTEAQNVMLLINEHNLKEKWPTLDEWKILLPEVFLENCGPDMTDKEVEEAQEELNKLSDEDRAIKVYNMRWPLQGWIGWMELEAREWFWWDAKVLNDTEIAVEILVKGWPFPWGALRWLFRGCGALDVICEENI